MKSWTPQEWNQPPWMDPPRLVSSSEVLYQNVLSFINVNAAWPHTRENQIQYYQMGLWLSDLTWAKCLLEFVKLFHDVRGSGACFSKREAPKRSHALAPLFLYSVWVLLCWCYVSGCWWVLGDSKGGTGMSGASCGRTALLSLVRGFMIWLQLWNGLICKPSVFPLKRCHILTDALVCRFLFPWIATQVSAVQVWSFFLPKHILMKSCGRAPWDSRRIIKQKTIVLNLLLLPMTHFQIFRTWWPIHERKLLQFRWWKSNELQLSASLKIPPECVRLRFHRHKQKPCEPPARHPAMLQCMSNTCLCFWCQATWNQPVGDFSGCSSTQRLVLDGTWLIGKARASVLSWMRMQPPLRIFFTRVCRQTNLLFLPVFLVLFEIFRGRERRHFAPW